MLSENTQHTLRQAGKTVGYFIGGGLITIGIAIGLLRFTVWIQAIIYDLLYLQVGPSAATKAAILIHFMIIVMIAMTIAMAVGDLLSNRLAHWRYLVIGMGTMMTLLLVFVVIALFGFAAFLTAIIVLGVSFVIIPAMLRYYYHIKSGAIPAFIGAIPVAILLFLLAGFGIGWGWGYILTAKAVPVSTVGPPDANFEAVPAVSEDLFQPENCTTEDGRRTCRLSLRGYEHELIAIRFLARYGVQCPYTNAGSIDPSSFIARHNDTLYRVSCIPHGD
ncbi:MAG: hypothetical protein ABEI06_06420 [Halobacteriaceae archaeon]